MDQLFSQSRDKFFISLTMCAPGSFLWTFMICSSTRRSMSSTWLSNRALISSLGSCQDHGLLQLLFVWATYCVIIILESSMESSGKYCPGARPGISSEICGRAEMKGVPKEHLNLSNLSRTISSATSSGSLIKYPRILWRRADRIAWKSISIKAEPTERPGTTSEIIRWRSYLAIQRQMRSLPSTKLSCSNFVACPLEDFIFSAFTS